MLIRTCRSGKQIVLFRLTVDFPFLGIVAGNFFFLRHHVLIPQVSGVGIKTYIKITTGQLKYIKAKYMLEVLCGTGIE